MYFAKNNIAGNEKTIWKIVTSYVKCLLMR